MPVYEYLCQSCQHRFEAKQRISEPPLTACVRCGRAVTKLISPPAIMFKGSGWYVTDYSDKLKPTDTGQSQPGDSATTKEKDGSAAAGKPAGTESSTPGATAGGTSSTSSTPTAAASTPSTSTTAPSKTGSS